MSSRDTYCLYGILNRHSLRLCWLWAQPFPFTSVLKLVKGRGWTAHREYIEGRKSAHTDDINKRPVFKEAMEDAMAGHYDVLVVHKIDRFSRKLRLALEYFEKLGKAA